MRYCRDKQIDKLVADLVREGWRFSRGKHGKLRTPCGRGFVTVPSTPSDHRTFQNLCRDIRRQVSAQRDYGR
jgi:predicted RNA binding protein YcfA (HicA-like mRNA interferase family)